MRHILLLLFICSSLLLSAQETIKINYETEIRPFKIKVEKVQYIGSEGVLVFGKIKQKKQFSYTISFAECNLSSQDNPDGVQGQLIIWNGNRKVPFTTMPISDMEEESFVLAFPWDSIPEDGIFNIKIGTVQNKNRTELIIPNLTLRKK